jgi:hypothetical protein
MTNIKTIGIALLLLLVLAVPLVSADNGNESFIGQVIDYIIDWFSDDVDMKNYKDVKDLYESLETHDGNGNEKLNKKEMYDWLNRTFNAVDTGLDQTKGMHLDWIDEGHCLGIDVNKGISSTVNMTMVLKDSDFSLNEISGFSFYEQYYEERYNNVYDYDCKTKNTLFDNGTRADVETCTQTLTDVDTYQVGKWADGEIIDTFVNDYGRFDTVQIDSDGYYKYCFDAPIESAGTVFVDLQEESYVDLQHSSWWNSSYVSRKVLYANMTSGTGDILFLANGTGKTLETEFCFLNQPLSATDQDTAILYYNDNTDYTFANNMDTGPTPFYCEGGAEFNKSVQGLFDFDKTMHHWFIGEQGGTTIKDVVNQTSLLFTGAPAPTFGPGRFGLGLSLEGTAAYVQGTIPQDTVDATRTISYWVYLNDKDNNDVHFSFNDGGSNRILIYTDGTNVVALNDGAWTITGNRSIALSQWHHIALTMGTGTQLYMDGELVAHTASSSLVSDVANNIYFGYAPANGYLNGVIDHISLLPDSKDADWVLRQWEYNLSRYGDLESDLIENVTIVPESIFPSTQMNCSANYTGNAVWGASGDIDFTWYKNDARITTYDQVVTGLTYGDIVQSNPVTETLVVGDSWKCNVFVTNGTITRNATINSSVLTVKNTPPTIPTTVSPSSGAFGVAPITLICDGGTDPDGGTVNYSIEVYDESKVFAVLSFNESTRYDWTPSSNFTYNYSCRSYDGTDYSSRSDNLTYEYNNGQIFQVISTYANPINELQSDTTNFEVIFNNLAVPRMNFSLQYVNNSYGLPDYDNSSYTGFTDTGSFNRSIHINTSVFVGDAAAGSNNMTMFADFGLNYTYNLTVNKIRLYNCTSSNSSNMAVLNVTLLDERNDTLINSNLDGTFLLFGSDGNKSNNISYSVSFENINNTFICIDGNTTYQSYAQLSYVAPGYDVRDYYLINATLDTVTEDVNLYLLPISLATGITFTVQDESKEGIEDFYILVQRYDVGLGAYKLVAMGQTDDDGDDYIFLRQYDAWYRFIIQNDTSVAFISENRKISTDSLIFTISDKTLSQYLTKIDGVTADLSFDNTTDMFTVTYTSGSLEVTEGCLKVLQRSGTTEQFLCDTCLTAASGTLTCDVGNRSGTFIGTFYVKGSPPTIISTIEVVRGVFNEISELIGLDGLIFTFGALVATTTVALATGSAVLVVALGIIVLFFAKLLGFLKVTTSILLGLVIVGGLIIALLKK